MRCYYCKKEIVGYRAFCFFTVGGRKVPFHLIPCLSDFQKNGEHQSNDTYSVRPVIWGKP